MCPCIPRGTVDRGRFVLLQPPRGRTPLLAPEKSPVMKRIATACIGIAALVVAPLAAFATEFTTGGHEETTENFSAAGWAAAAAATPGFVAGGVTGTHLSDVRHPPWGAVKQQYR